MRKGMVLLMVGALGMVLAFSGASAATVLRGSLLVGISTGCAGAPGCVAWRAAGCPTQLAMANGVDHSAVDVSAFRGRTGTFSPRSPLASTIGGDSVGLTFLSAQCQTMGSSFSVSVGQDRSLLIPSTAKWLTVVGLLVTGSNVSWTLTFA